MQKSLLPKLTSYNIGRAFNLLFNRISMYHLDHPATVQGVEEFLKALREGFRIVPSVSFIMLHDKFFLEEQPFDPRINTSKMLPHFKKANIQDVLLF